MAEKTILNEIADYAVIRVEECKKKVSLEKIKEEALKCPKTGFLFEENLKKPGMSFICECKKASPSKGVIAEHFPYLEIAKAYDAAGASAISVLTEPKWFLGSDEYLREIAANVSIPVLRKDFTVDEYQIYEAKTLGASAVLLICAILTKEQITKYIKICDELNLSALVEAHDADEIAMAIECGARVIGVNNRNLKDFTVDVSNSGNLRGNVPEGIVFVAESGIKERADVASLEAMKVDAVLVGETLMRADNIADKLHELKGI